MRPNRVGEVRTFLKFVLVPHVVKLRSPPNTSTPRVEEFVARTLTEADASLERQ
jgi:hypothetical protein